MPAGDEEIDAAFAEIVAALEREGLDASWPEDAAQSGLAAHPASGKPTVASETEHYIAPEPPKMPRLRPGTVLALLLIMLSIILLAVPALAGLGNPVTTPVALVVLVAGVGWLVLRMRQDPLDPLEEPDDGAQV